MRNLTARDPAHLRARPNLVTQARVARLDELAVPARLLRRPTPAVHPEPRSRFCSSVRNHPGQQSVTEPAKPLNHVIRPSLHVSNEPTGSTVRAYSPRELPGSCPIRAQFGSVRLTSPSRQRPSIGVGSGAESGLNATGTLRPSGTGSCREWCCSPSHQRTRLAQQGHPLGQGAEEQLALDPSQPAKQ